MGVGDAMISRIVDLKAQRPIKGQQKIWKKMREKWKKAGEDHGYGQAGPDGPNIWQSIGCRQHVVELW